MAEPNLGREGFGGGYISADVLQCGSVIGAQGGFFSHNTSELADKIRLCS